VSIETTIEEGVAFIKVSGDLDTETGPLLLDAGRQALTDFVNTLRIDLSEVTFMDSSGLNALIGIRNLALARHTLIVDHPSAKVRRIFEVTGLTQAFGITEPGLA